MSDNATPSLPDLQARLHGVAQLLREPRPLDADSRQALAELVDELGKALQSGQVPSAEVAVLAETTAHLAEALHQQPPAPHVAGLRERFEDALIAAETRAPFVAGLARRLLDTLSNIGI
jgi:hypothetical protein